MNYNKLTKSLMLIASTILLLQGSLEAQNLHVKGTVKDASSGEALPFVNVALMRPADTVFLRGATTDMDGRFDVRGVDTGSYLIQCSFIGYIPYSKALTVVDDVDDYDITLTQGIMLDAVEVVADKPLYAMDGEKNMYNTKDDPSVQTGTASDALQNAPGVEVDAEGNITLRGVSSVEIWINDRPSHMEAEALKQYIKSLPANAIERIEVITNPSARYSTTGGVINIVTNQKVTRNELLCVGVRGSSMPHVSPWVSYVYANEKFDLNFYLNGSYSQHNSYSDGTTLLRDANGDTSRYQSYDSKDKNRNVGGYAGFNINWNIDSKTNLVGWMGMYPFWGHGETTNNYAHMEYPSMTDLGYHSFYDGDGFGWGGYAGLWFEHRFDTTGRKVSVSFNGNTWSQHNKNTSVRDYSSPLLPDLTRRSDSYNSNPHGSLTVNYVQPLKHNFELEAGVETEFGGGTAYEYLDSLNAAGDYVSERLRSTEGVERGTGLSGYVTLLKRFGQFTVKGGLRAEQAWKRSEWQRRDGSDFTEVDTSFFGLVPSLHLSYRTKDFQNYSLSYTRRFSTPGMTQLSTFRNYDDYSFSTGNPALLISYTHNVEAAWNKYFMKFGNVGLNAYFRANTDEVGTMTLAGTDPYFSHLVNYTIPVNIGSSHTEGLEANITYRPTAFVNVRLNASVFNYAYNYDDFSDHKLSWSARLNVWTKLWNRLEVFANAHYRSPQLSLYSMSVANKGVDFGVSSDFFDRRMSVYFNVNDIFGMAEWGSNTTAPQYQTTGSQRFDSRFVSLGLTWRIGKMELESKARQGGDTGTSGVGQGM